VRVAAIALVSREVFLRFRVVFEPFWEFRSFSDPDFSVFRFF
jgi:hypothetical protein